MSIAKLIIYPVDFQYFPDNPSVIVQTLSDMEFIGKALPSNGHGQRFLIGEQFLNFITFLGCSPAIEIEPQENGSEDFCHVVIDAHKEQVEFIPDAAGKGPRCPHCRHEEKQWQELTSQTDDILKAEYVCPQCGEVTPLMNLNWRKSAVAGQMFISIYSVFPNEAVLADKVLSELEAVSGVQWRYFYSR